MDLDNEKSKLCKFCENAYSPEISNKCVRGYREKFEKAWETYSQTKDMERYVKELNSITERIKKKNKSFMFEINLDGETPLGVNDCVKYKERKPTGD